MASAVLSISQFTLLRKLASERLLEPATDSNSNYRPCWTEEVESKQHTGECVPEALA